MPLPEGYTLDTAAPSEGLPAGYTLDSQEQQPSWGDIGKDVAASTAIGVPKGIIGIAGLPEVLAGYGASALGYLTGRDPESFRDQGAMRLPTTQQIRSKVEDVTGPLYEPKTPYGQYGQTFGEFIPAALTGPGGIARRIVGQALIPGLATEGAGQAAAAIEPAAEPYVRGATALVTGMRGVRSADVAAADVAKQNLMSEAQAGTKALYKAFDDAAITAPVPMGGLMGTRQQMLNDLNSVVQDTSLAEKLVGKLQGQTVNDLRNWRLDMRDTLYKAGNSKSAQVLTRDIDQAIDRFMPAGAPGSDLLRTADRQFAHNELMKAITGKLATAEEGTSAAHSGMNADNKIRQALISFKKDERNFHALTPTEQLKVDQIIDGGIGKNAIRAASNLAGGGGGLGQLMAFYVMNEISGSLGMGAAAVAAGKVLKHSQNALARGEERGLIADIMGRSMFAPAVGRLNALPFYQRTPRGFVYGELAPESNQ